MLWKKTAEAVTQPHSCGWGSLLHHFVLLWVRKSCLKVWVITRRHYLLMPGPLSYPMPVPLHLRSPWSSADVSLLPKATQDTWWEHIKTSELKTKDSIPIWVVKRQRNSVLKCEFLKEKSVFSGHFLIHGAQDCRDSRAEKRLFRGGWERWSELLSQARVLTRGSWEGWPWGWELFRSVGI